jgi:hypothetical protein
MRGRHSAKLAPQLTFPPKSAGQSRSHPLVLPPGALVVTSCGLPVADVVPRTFQRTRGRGYGLPGGQTHRVSPDTPRDGGAADARRLTSAQRSARRASPKARRTIGAKGCLAKSSSRATSVAGTTRRNGISCRGSHGSSDVGPPDGPNEHDSRLWSRDVLAAGKAQGRARMTVAHASSRTSRRSVCSQVSSHSGLPAGSSHRRPSRLITTTSPVPVTQTPSAP